MKKKIFTKATLLFLAAMIMLMPLTISAFSADNAIITDDCCIVLEDEPVVTMSSGGACPLYCSHEWVSGSIKCSFPGCTSTFTKKTCDNSTQCGGH